LLFRLICFGPAEVNCELLPLATYSTRPPDFKKAAVCSSISADVKTTLTTFLLMTFPRVDIGLFANIKATVYLKQEIIAGGALQGRLFTHTIPPLCLQQRPLSLQSPAITAKPAIAPQYTMAGNQHTNPVLATS